MAQCATCGNDYDKSFEVKMNGKNYIFDSFECAIQALAPQCSHCGCRILGHGIEGDGSFFCCAHCARHAGVQGVDDRADSPASGVQQRGRPLAEASARH